MIVVDIREVFCLLGEILNQMGNYVFKKYNNNNNNNNITIIIKKERVGEKNEMLRRGSFFLGYHIGGYLGFTFIYSLFVSTFFFPFLFFSFSFCL